MLFDPNIEPCCAYCRFGFAMDESEIACLKRGIMSAAGRCARFKYDPLKREPESAVYRPSESHTEKDFEL